VSHKCSVVDPSTLAGFDEVLRLCDTYVGSSMHGYIVASQFGAKSALILNGDPYAKFRAAIESINPAQYVFSSGTAFDSLLLSHPIPALISSAKATALDGLSDVLNSNLSLEVAPIHKRYMRSCVIRLFFLLACAEKIFSTLVTRLFKR
jgi:hypothetical protein